MDLGEILRKLKMGKIDLDRAEKEIRLFSFEAFRDIAKIDVGRGKRVGIPEAVLAEDKRPEDVVGIARVHLEKEGKAIVTRVSEGHLEALRGLAGEVSAGFKYHDLARVVVLSKSTVNPTGGKVGVISAGTSDIPVAEEARIIAEEMGCAVTTIYDVGAAGIHRLFPELGRLIQEEVDVIIVAAGREGTLPTIVSGLVDVPVIGLPVSTGYGAGGKGRAALGAMLQSCSVLAVVNIDAGFTAGAFAGRIANLAARARNKNL